MTLVDVSYVQPAVNLNFRVKSPSFGILGRPKALCSQHAMSSLLTQPHGQGNPGSVSLGLKGLFKLTRMKRLQADSEQPHIFSAALSKMKKEWIEVHFLLFSTQKSPMLLSGTKSHKFKSSIMGKVFPKFKIINRKEETLCCDTKLVYCTLQNLLYCTLNTVVFP
jgi:hypothetical protein